MSRRSDAKARASRLKYQGRSMMHNVVESAERFYGVSYGYTRL